MIEIAVLDDNLGAAVCLRQCTCDGDFTIGGCDGDFRTRIGRYAATTAASTASSPVNVNCISFGCCTIFSSHLHCYGIAADR